MCLLPGDFSTKTRRPVADVLREKHTNMHGPPVVNPTCVPFEEYKEMPETVPLNFSEDDIS